MATLKLMMLINMLVPVPYNKIYDHHIRVQIILMGVLGSLELI
jgi:hypothetical protein